MTKGRYHMHVKLPLLTLLHYIHTTIATYIKTLLRLKYIVLHAYNAIFIRVK